MTTNVKCIVFALVGVAVGYGLCKWSDKRKAAAAAAQAAAAAPVKK